MTIGDRIRNRRIELDMSQEELALLVGYTSRSTINKIEQNANNLRQTKIADIAKALRVSPAYLMGWDDETDVPDYVPGTVEIIDLFSRATPEQREAVLSLLRSFVNNN